MLYALNVCVFGFGICWVSHSVTLRYNIKPQSKVLRNSITFYTQIKYENEAKQNLHELIFNYIDSFINFAKENTPTYQQYLNAQSLN